MHVRAYTMGAPGITVRRGYVQLGDRSKKGAWVPVVDDTPRGPLGRLRNWLTGRYTLREGIVEYAHGRIQIRSCAVPQDEPAHALILLNPAAGFICWHNIEIRISPGVEILRETKRGQGEASELLVLAPAGAEIKCKIEFVPVEMASGPDMMSPLAGAFLPELEVNYTLKVEQDGTVTETR